MVWKKLKSTFREEAMRLAGDEVIREDGRQLVLILTASRCAEAIPWKEPTIGTVAEISHLNRNLVGNVTTALSGLGLVEITRRGRSGLIGLTEVGEIYSDLVVGKTDLTRLYFDRPTKELRKGSVTQESVERLEEVQSAFHLAKGMFGKNTLNYEIYDTLHDEIIQLIAALRSERNDEAKTLLKNITESLLAMEESKKKANALGLKPLLLKDTGERIGRGRIFRPVRRK